MIDDEQQINGYLETARMHADAQNEFGHGYWLGRALEYADQNAVDPEWMRESLEACGLDSALVGVPKLENVHRG